MKHLPAILLMTAAVLFASAPAQAAPILDFAVRVGCDFQQPERGLMDLHVLQGSTPLVLAMPKAGNTALTPDLDTSVRMIIGPTETGSIYAVRTNYAIAGGGYAIDWPTIGTNSSGQAWFYTLLFDREGKTYWSGSGALYIDASGYTGPDGVEWIEFTTPNTTWQNILGDDPSTNAALKAYIESQLGSGEPLWIAASNSVVSGIATNAAAIAIMGTGKLDVAAAATTYQPIGDYALTAALAGYVPTNRTITINGVAHDLSSDRAWTVECGGGGIDAAEAGQIATNVLLTATTNSIPLIDFGSGGGWTNLSFSGTGNAITNATAAGDTLTLERGTVEGGGGTTFTNAASIGVEGDSLTYSFATNIALLASTNLWPQRILEVTNDFALQVPTMSDTNAAGIIWLTVPPIGAYTATIPTNSPPVLGYVPALSTNAESELLLRWTPGAAGWRLWRLR